jgi:hypothetical protein
MQLGMLKHLLFGSNNSWKSSNDYQNTTSCSYLYWHPWQWWNTRNNMRRLASRLERNLEQWAAIC